MAVLIGLGVVVVILLIIMAVTGRAADKKHTQNVSARLGGSPGWPTPTWQKDHKQLGLNPYYRKSLRNDRPVHGHVEVPGVPDTRLPFVTYSCRLQRTEQGITSSTTYTWAFTAIAIPAVNPSISDVEILSTMRSASGKPVWEPYWENRSLEDQLYRTGDQQFDEYFTVHSPDHHGAASVLTERVRRAFLLLYKFNPAPRVRIRQGVLFVWARQGVGQEVRDSAEFQNLLSAAAILAFELNAASVATSR
ncbi:hypothetical protein [Nocardia concava]|uniref:hypothetical protein n=1 Tax=Nocardia concava TaxID=257281 RepID=UPI00059267B4|nr:hypothetical protein [Nocardia concava]